ncbi:MAG TPA: pirin family protein [Xanthomonadales bacterium]|nr:pirin family protein [Xanthomonadales bacterium]
MLNVRRAQERGNSNHGWLNSHHTFSFAEYYDPKHMGFADLRVINDDIVAPGKGFGTHPHRDMEIISYVLDGALEHRDSMGNGSVIRPGDVQRMSAGTGVTHSEFNHSSDDEVHFLQIWVLPDQKGHTPGYQQKHFSNEEKRGRLRLIASHDGDDSSVTLNQDVKIYSGLLNDEETFSYNTKPNRVAWIHVARGEVELNDEKLQAGDGVSVNPGQSLEFRNGDHAEVLVFDMAA